LIKRCGNKEAIMIGHAYFGTEHFLLGFLRLGSGAVYEALRNQGVTIESARSAVLACLSSAPEKDETTPNQALLPTSMSFTDRAGARSAPDTLAADL
jgi:ATP-dependent Clp protease ATP-binding subunit ClpA